MPVVDKLKEGDINSWATLTLTTSYVSHLVWEAVVAIENFLKIVIMNFYIKTMADGCKMLKHHLMLMQ